MAAATDALAIVREGVSRYNATESTSGTTLIRAIMSPVRTWSPGSTAISAIMPDIWGLCRCRWAAR